MEFPNAILATLHSYTKGLLPLKSAAAGSDVAIKRSREPAKHQVASYRCFIDIVFLVGGLYM